MAHPTLLERSSEAGHEGAASGAVERLRGRMREMQDGVPRLPVATPPELAGLVRLRTGGSYQVDGAGLALALLAAPSRTGAWTAVIGLDDFGVEAAEEMGVDLARTVLVPDPGEHWPEVTAALIDVLPVVLLRPPAQVGTRTASRIAARLRKRSSTLLVAGAWPGCEARLSVTEAHWTGIEHGHGRLRARRVVVSCQRGSAPARHAALWLPATDAPLRAADETSSGEDRVLETG